jgi:hypothetical protein
MTVRAWQAAPAILYYGSFTSTVTQSSAGITSDNIVPWSNTSIAKGITISQSDPTKIIFANTGTYNVNFLGQFTFSGGASNYNIECWYSKNGVVVPNSGYVFTTTSAQGAQVLANVEVPIQVVPGDYIQFHWWSGAAGMQLLYTAAGTNPTRPASPSANLTIFNVG